MKNSVKSNLYYLFTGLSVPLYIYLFFAHNRLDFTLFIALQTALFGMYFYVLHQNPTEDKFSLALNTSLLIRFIAIFSFPALSDDFYRFLWDGQMSLHGISPFAYTPVEATNLGLYQNEQLLELMNSPDYYTVYPPLNQSLFLMATAIAPDSMYWQVVILKSCMFIAECGSIWLIMQLLDRFKLPQNRVLLYALNPLVIIEFCGNLHFEGIMLCFVLWSIHLLARGRWVISFIVFSLAVITKFLPILLLPLALSKLKVKNWALYCSGVVTLSLGSFYLFYHPDMFNHIGQSLSLYFNLFEFNSSFYRITEFIQKEVIQDHEATWVHYFYKIPFLVVMLIVMWKYSKKDINRFFQGALFVFTLYLVQSSSIHPWYVLPLLAYALFTRFRYIYMWSALLPLTYITYITYPYQQQSWVIFVGYTGWIAVCLWELLSRNRNAGQVLTGI